MQFYFVIFFTVTTIELGTDAKTISENLERSGDSGIEISNTSGDKFKNFESSGDSENNTLDQDSIEDSAGSEASGEFGIDPLDALRKVPVFFGSSATDLSNASDKFEPDIEMKSNKSIPTRFCIILLTLFFCL